MAACSITGSEHVSTELLFKHPAAAPGLGKVALRAALQLAYHDTPCETVGIVVRAENDGMLRLCQSIGFRAIEHEQGKPWALHIRGREKLEQALGLLGNLIPYAAPEDENY